MDALFMKPNPHIKAIYLAPSAGAKMSPVSQARISADLGFEGDRYALGIGAYSAALPAKIRDVSLISQASIDIANEWQEAGGEAAFKAADTRRNIVLNGISSDELNKLVGQQFLLGDILMFGIELCAPCERPAQLIDRKGFTDAFDGRGGIRAKVLTSGVIYIGDMLFIKNGE